MLIDHEISPSQAFNLEKEVGAEVMDRTMVILEIFHRHASSRFARAQVEIARLGYMGPRLDAAAAYLVEAYCSLPTSPTVARQRTSTLRISPDGIRSWASGPSLATSCTLAPAERAILAPPPGRSSIACTTVPTGMLRSGRALPGLMSALGPFSIAVALLEQSRREDVALLAVGVVQQRDPRGAVRVVLDVRDLGRHAVLVVPTEVDHPVGALVAAALVPRGDLARVVAAALVVQRADQRLLRRGHG